MTTNAPWSRRTGGLTLSVRLTPKGGRDALDGVERLADGAAVLKARVRAAPHEGAANEALVRLVARSLGVAPSRVALTAGAAARIKTLRVEGDPAALAAKLDALSTEAAS